MKKDKNEPSLFSQAAQTPARSEGKKTSAFLRRTATEVMRYRIIKKIILISAALISAFLLIIYSFALVYDRTGRLTVSVKEMNEGFNITLAEYPDFRMPTTLLSNDNLVKMTNICGKDLPKDLDTKNGDYHGDNYLGYTFYCKNLRSSACSLAYELNYNNVTNKIDEAIRVRLYVDGEYTDYAKVRSDGGGKEDHFCDKSFANQYTVCYGIANNVPSDGVVRFTIVIWLEGDDDDCQNYIINGSVKFSMEIKSQDVV